ncbi:MAG: FHA domain-containing protein [Gammaproteobacteria bacterium]|jgi:hypothetical protein
MLQNIFSKPVELNIGEKLITFKSMEDFEFAMNARSMLPQSRVSEAINATANELNMESNTIDIAIEQIAELIKQSKESEVTQKLKSVNPVIFSNDNNWRDIFFALKKHRSAESSQYKLIALKAYLQYLKHRKETIQSMKKRLDKLDEKQNNAEPVQFRTGELDIDDNFDSNVLAKELGLKSMPTGEYVNIKVEKGDEISLLLANYQCKLIIRDGIKFVDSDNVSYPITTGMNKVGRGRECSVRFNDTVQRISRLHLIIINHDNKKLELSDVSTYGSFYLKKQTKD